MRRRGSAIVKNSVSISDFNRGKAGKIFDELNKKGTMLVIKNSQPEGVLLSLKEYVDLMDELEDLRITVIAAERLMNKDPNAKTYTSEEMMQKLGITQEDVDNAEDDEIE